MECEYCNNKFKSLSSLNNHKKTAKYCLEKQNKNNTEYNCSYCAKVFTTKNAMNNHEMKCKETHILIEEYKKEIFLLKENMQEKNQQIKELQDQLASIARTAASRPTHVQNNNQRINNVINNMLPITEEHLIEQAQYLTLEHIKQGANGYVQYALEYPLKDRIICVDYSRRKIKYKDQEDNIIEDPEMIKLSQKFFKAIENTNSELINNHLVLLGQQIEELNSSSSNNMDEEETKDFEEESNDILNKTFDMMKHKKEVIEASKGKKPEIYFDFVKNICAKVTK